MKKTLIILRHEFRQAVRRKSFLLVTLALPLLLVAGYGIYKAVESWYEPGVSEEMRIGYVDETGEFNDYQTASGVVFVVYASESEAREALLTEGIDEYFVIPADYISVGAITRYTMESEIEVPGQTLSHMASFLRSNLLSGTVSPEVMERTKNPLLLNSLRLDETGEMVAAKSAFATVGMPFVFAMLFFISLFVSAGTLFQSVTEEKENRVIEILLSSVSPKQLLVGKVLGLGAAGLIQIIVWLVAMTVFVEVASVDIAVLRDVSLSAGILALACLYFVLGYLVFAALYAGAGSLCGTAREAQSLSVIFVIPAVLPLWFMSFIVSGPDTTLSKVLTLFPLSSPLTAMMRLPNETIPTWELALSLTILVASVGLTMWVAAKVFRTYLLMYGKRPSLREILSYVRSE